MASAILHPDAAGAIRQAIADAGQCEVFFLGRPGSGHLIAEVEVLARGHRSAVPAVLNRVRSGETVIHNHPSGDLLPSEADLGIAGQAGAMGAAFVIVDNQASKAYVVVEPAPPVEVKPIDAEEVARELGPKGPLASCLEGYEHREQQVTMARAVAEALNHQRVVMIEAGTGTGKSLAYLLPAIHFAVRNRERVVVSTNTINLQEQLVNKDLPFLRDRLGLEFKSVLLKGRGNYLCLRKAEFAGQEQERLFAGEVAEQLKAVLAWARSTTDGSRSAIGFPVAADVWDAVASDADDCLRVKSPYYETCHFYGSRREAAAADVVVVNHSLLMADLATRAATGDFAGAAVLPPYSRVILDEAHHLEDAASSYFGTSVGAVGILRGLGRLRPERDEKKGVLVALAAKVGSPGGATGGTAGASGGELDALLARALAGQRDLGERVRERFTAIADHAMRYLGLDQPEGNDELKVRLKPEVLAHPAFAEGIVPECHELTKEIGQYAALLALLLDHVKDLPGGDDRVSLVSAIGAVRLRLEAAAEALAAFPAPDPEAQGQCRWLELKKSRRGGEVQARLLSAPLEVAELLRENLHERMKTVVMTSATLTVGGRFDHFRDRLGLGQLGPVRLATTMLLSPFDFARQARVVIVKDMPEPQEPTFAEAAREVILEAVTRSAGRAFVLFTAYGLLDRTAKALAPRLEGAGLNLLCQGKEPRDRLLQRFRREKGSVLFAVDSFWEGVDVAGNALSLVVLVRLPFRVPTEPLQAARVEALERAGRDPFLDYAVPQAVIKFRQGFGRLIRSRSDRGVVLVLDPRVLSKRYGRLFLDSLPGVPVEAVTRAGAGGAVGAFLDPKP